MLLYFKNKILVMLAGYYNKLNFSEGFKQT